jgi:hypothetical protein
VVEAALISDADPFDDTDPIAITTTVKVKIRANDPDPAGSEAPSGLASYCIVRYRFNVAQRFWEPFDCTFTPLPAPEGDGSFIVNETISPLGGVVYAFVWVRDNAGNISRQPAFAFISFLPERFNLNRNNVAIFRIPLPPGESLTLSFTPDFGDVDVALFDDFRDPNANRIALSANNGTACEEVTLQGQDDQPNRFQVEVRAFANSRVQVGEGCPPNPLAAAASEAPAGIHQAAETPLIAGPPALRSAIEDEGEDAAGDVFLPLIRTN